jgi:hypothetical protein
MYGFLVTIKYKWIHLYVWFFNTYNVVSSFMISMPTGKDELFKSVI